MGIQGVYVDVASFRGMSETKVEKGTSKYTITVGRSAKRFYNLTVLPNQPGFLLLSLSNNQQSIKELTQKLFFIFQEKVPLILAERGEKDDCLKGTYLRANDPKPVDDAAAAFNRMNKLSVDCRQKWCRWMIGLQTLFDELPIPLDWIAHKNGQTWEGIKVRYFKGITEDKDLPLLIDLTSGKGVIKEEVCEKSVEMDHNIPLVSYARAAKSENATWFPIFAQLSHEAMGSVYRVSLDQNVSSVELRLECLKMMLYRVAMAVIQPFILLDKMLFVDNPYTYICICNKGDDWLTSIALSPVVNILGAIKCLVGAIIHPSVMIKSL
jgi:hypothetical protein